MDGLDKLLLRLRKIGIEIVVHSNVPWIYLVEVNGKVVGSKFQSEHGFVIAYVLMSNPFGDTVIALSDIKEIFKVIRKYK